MLAFAPSSTPSYNYAPTIPSPLSPRSANIYGSRRHQSYNHMNNEQHAKSSKIGSGDNTSTSISSATTNFNATSSNSKTPFSQRPIKRAPVPVSQNSRRNAYLRKVSTQREDRRFETRGEDMMRLDFMQRQRAWEAERAALAASQVLEEEEEEEEEPYDLPMQSSMPEAEVEEFLRDEGKELEALLEYMPDDAMKEDDFDETSLWSDDADYDALFSEVLGQQEQEQGRPAPVQSSQLMPNMQQHGNGGDDEMDMS